MFIRKSLIAFVSFLPLVIPQKDFRTDSELRKLITSNGYPFENYTVTTEDGYILTLHRIPYGREKDSEDRIPILLCPFFLGSSADWFALGLNRSLGYMLADNGFDVWMQNHRGTTWSRKHKFLDPDNPEDKKRYWDFSFHEIGIYDIPACIDFILKTTNKSKMQVLGYSQGTTSFFVAMSEKPEYLEKISLFTAIAPVTYTKALCSPAGNAIDKYINFLKIKIKNIPGFEMLPFNPEVSTLGRNFCKDGSPIQSLCAEVLFVVNGPGSNKLDRSILPDIAKFTPAGASFKQIVHFLQLKENFAQFNYDPETNKMIYGQKVPPNYDLSKVTVPIAVFSGSVDCLAVPQNVEKTVKGLPNIVLYKVVNGYSHLDFGYGKNVHEDVYRDVIKIVNQYKYVPIN